MAGYVATTAAKCSGVSSYTVTPASRRGWPAFGWAHVAPPVSSPRIGTSAAMGSQLISQLQPTRSAPAAVSAATACSGVTPIMVRKPLAAGLKAMLARTGRPPAAATASSTAMVASVRSNIVSMLRRSTPPATKARACSLKVTRRASGSALPIGLTIWPHGPMSPATKRPGNSRSRTATASRAPAWLSSTARDARPCAARRMPVPPKVLVLTISEPAAKKLRWMSSTSDGCETFHSSGHSPAWNPRSMSARPRPPSRSSGRSAMRARRSTAAV
ncbi:MAG: hypothetical protein BWY94_02458 [Actinobacteria bacterium ADurb.BinA094]|nr:MAG: hypothetical protein BWY94_02458 [Actinobacteria bacterium ADurb.BinA094]